MMETKEAIITMREGQEWVKKMESMTQQTVLTLKKKGNNSLFY